MTLRSRTLVARRLRRDATDVERLFWRVLRERCPQWKFRRQHPIGRRIADFPCPAQKLVVELDGSQHGERELADTLRTIELGGNGCRVIRFWNSEVLENIEGVLETILLALESPPPHPNPLRPRGAEREMNLSTSNTATSEP
jgi:very-short-patch-repair endonuclease